MCDFDGDLATVWRNEIRKAKKDYACCGCGLPILAGSLYQYHFDLFEGEVNTERGCLECAAANKIFSDAHAGGPSVWHLLDSLNDCIDGTGKEERKLGNIQLWRDLIAGLKMRRRKAERIKKEREDGKIAA